MLGLHITNLVLPVAVALPAAVVTAAAWRLFLAADVGHRS
jgi:hypothetical protein